MKKKTFGRLLTAIATIAMTFGIASLGSEVMNSVNNSLAKILVFAGMAFTTILWIAFLLVTNSWFSKLKTLMKKSLEAYAADRSVELMISKMEPDDRQKLGKAIEKAQAELKNTETSELEKQLYYQLNRYKAWLW